MSEPSDHVDQVGHVLLVQPGEREPLEQLVALEIGECGGQGLGAIHLGAAIRAQDEERRIADGAHDMGQERQRRPVRPMQILDRQDQRCRRGDVHQQASDGAVEPMALPRRVPAHRLGEIG